MATSQTLTCGGIVANNGGIGGLTKTGAGILTLTGSNTYSGPTTLSAGSLLIGASNNLGDGSATNTITIGTATLRSTANSYDLGVNRAITLTGNGKIQADAGTLTVSGTVTNGANLFTLFGAGNISVSGVIGTGATPTGGLNIGSTTLPANVTLSGNNLFTGNVSLPANNTQPKAVLTLTNSGALGVGPKTVSSTGANGTNGGEIHLQNNISLASDISFNVSGFTIYNDSGSNTINGNITMASGAGATYLTSTSGTLTVNGNMSATATARSLRLRGDGNGVITGIIANGSTVDLPVLKDLGTGTWTLSGANTYTGGTTVSAGTLALGASHTIPDVSAVSIGSATLDAATFTDTVGTLDVTSTATINLGTGAKLVFANSSGVGSGTWAGTLTITGDFVSGSSLNFGSSTGLTAQQLSKISATGFTNFALDAEGDLTATAGGGGYSAWAAINAIGSAPDQDKDGDGVNNATEYVLGGTVSTNDLSKLPAVSTSGGNLLFTFKRAQTSIDGSTNVTIQVGTTLLAWPDSYNVPGPAQANVPGVSIVKDTSPGFDTVTLSVPQATDARKFARLNVVVTP